MFSVTIRVLTGIEYPFLIITTLTAHVRCDLEVMLSVARRTTMPIVIPDPEELERPVPTAMQTASMLKAIHDHTHDMIGDNHLHHAENINALADLHDDLKDILDKLEDIRELLVPTP